MSKAKTYDHMATAASTRLQLAVTSKQFNAKYSKLMVQLPRLGPQPRFQFINLGRSHTISGFQVKVKFILGEVRCL